MLLKNCRLIPELSGMCQLTLADVELSKGRIRAITPAETGLSCQEDSIDCKGRTLLPGLFDLHAHVSVARAKETPEDGMTRLVQAMGRLQAYIDLGITTIRDCGSTLHLAIPLRDAVQDGIIKGPRILASGYMLGPQIMHNLGREQMMVMDIANTEDEFRIAARKQLALGADFIKLYASESATQCLQKDPFPILRREEIRAVVEIAEMAGTYVAAHAHSLSSIKLCLEGGVHCIEHATFIDEETVKRLEEYPNVFLNPTFAVLMPPEQENTVDEVSNVKTHMLGRASANIRNAYQAGLKLGFGSDLINGELARFYHEFRIRKEYCGMKNVDILLQATKYSAQIARLAGITGEVKAGLSADLILVDGNPDEDISVMYKKPLMVFKDGEQLR